ncbi:hypothetical protein [Amycolatopsis anabasis]|uniref:hypothetical protein n=1 Tax=Amycolatopsis anabasis TaxID=1840409 RepID=UPI00131D747A|nr:hypothetical protein [Amycolatopsis anabasis]
MAGAQRWLLGVLLLDTVLLALLELFFLPLRLDGVVLPEAADFPLPLSVVVAALTTPLLVRQTARLVTPKVSFAPLVLWVLVMLVVGVFGPGGDVVLVQDWRALLLLACGALPAAMTLGGALGAANKTNGEKRG